MTNVDDQRQPDQDRLTQHLRAEADASRPAFDESLHTQIMQGVRQHRHAAPGRARTSIGWRRWAAVAALVTVAVTVALLLTGRPPDAPQIAANGSVADTSPSLWAADLSAPAAWLQRNVGSETLVADTVNVVADWAEIDRDVQAALQFVDRYAVTLALATD